MNKICFLLMTLLIASGCEDANISIAIWEDLVSCSSGSDLTLTECQFYEQKAQENGFPLLKKYEDINSCQDEYRNCYRISGYNLPAAWIPRQDAWMFVIKGDKSRILPQPLFKKPGSNVYRDISGRAYSSRTGIFTIAPGSVKTLPEKTGSNK